MAMESGLLVSAMRVPLVDVLYAVSLGNYHIASSNIGLEFLRPSAINFHLSLRLILTSGLNRRVFERL